MKGLKNVAVEMCARRIVGALGFGGCVSEQVFESLRKIWPSWLIDIRVVLRRLSE
jgi:hypothetical protein